MRCFGNRRARDSGGASVNRVMNRVMNRCSHGIMNCVGHSFKVRNSAPRRVGAGNRLEIGFRRGDRLNIRFGGGHSLEICLRGSRGDGCKICFCGRNSHKIRFRRGRSDSGRNGWPQSGAKRVDEAKLIGASSGTLGSSDCKGTTEKSEADKNVRAVHVCRAQGC